MTLKEIEEIVLATIGYDRYSSLSVATDAEKVEDFALLHKCVLFARDKIRLETTIPALLKFATTIATSTTQALHTITDTDFDLPQIVLFTDSTGKQKKLTKIDMRNVEDLIPLTSIDVPNYYSIFGSTATALTQLVIFPISRISGSLDIIYKPTLSNLTTATDQDVIMAKYPYTVVNLATAYAFQILKKDMTNCEKWMGLGASDFKNITLRESTTDWNEQLKTEVLLAFKRSQRLTV